MPRVKENRYLVSYRFHLGTYAHHIKTLLIIHVLDVELLIFISIYDSLAIQIALNIEKLRVTELFQHPV